MSKIAASKGVGKNRGTYNRFFPYKALIYADRIERIVADEFPAPVVWHVYPSNVCNVNCGFCIMRDERGKRNNAMLSREVLLKCARDGAENDVKLFHVSGGGEPLTNPHLLEFVRVVKSYRKGPKLALSSNGGLFGENKLELVKFFDHIRISLDAATAESYGLIKGTDPSVFQTVCDNIRRIVAYAKDNDCQVDIGAAFVITLDNWTHICEFVELAKSLGVNFVHMRPAFYERDDPRNEAVKLLVPSIVAQAGQARRQFESDDFQVYAVTEKFEGYWTERTYSKCRSTPLQAVLCADGRFAVCQDVFIKFGDYTSQTFWEAWDSEEHRQAIDRICLDSCPRCVETTQNQIIEEIFINNTIRRELI